MLENKESGGDMDNYSIKTVTFGGFDKQDVIRYIEESAQTAAAAQKKLQSQNDALVAENASLRARLDAISNEMSTLQARLQALTADHTQLQETMARETAARLELEPLRPLQEEVDRLRPDAEAYAQFREKIGSIECEARKRASDLEIATVNQLQETLDLFREQYQVLMNSFESTATHVTSELRKIEVNLAQLPRTMDQPGSELNELMTRLETIKQNHA
jgi:chromosome segregation ATPase